MKKPQRERIHAPITRSEQKLLIEEALRNGYASVDRFIETILTEGLIKLYRRRESKHTTDPEKLRKIRERIERLEGMLAKAKADRRRPP
jgi:hypothetical protein